MAIENYGELKSSVALWLNRDDDETLAQLPVFINMAEKQIYRALRIPEMEGEREYVLREGDTYIYVPTDILELKQIYIIEEDEESEVERVYRAVRTSYDKLLDMPLVGGDTCVFARHVERYYFRYLPSSQIKMRVMYYRDPQELVNDTDTNYLLSIAPELFLFTALRFGSMFNRDMESEAMWTQKAGEVFLQLQSHADTSEWAGSRKDQADVNDVDLSFLEI